MNYLSVIFVIPFYSCILYCFDERYKRISRSGTIQFYCIIVLYCIAFYCNFHLQLNLWVIPVAFLNMSTSVNAEVTVSNCFPVPLMQMGILLQW